MNIISCFIYTLYIYIFIFVVNKQHTLTDILTQHLSIDEVFTILLDLVIFCSMSYIQIL